MLPTREIYEIRVRHNSVITSLISPDQRAQDTDRLLQLNEDLMRIIRTLLDAAPLLCATCSPENQCERCAVRLARSFLYGRDECAGRFVQAERQPAPKRVI